ncbi:hypothetical protein KCP77_04080 [Salmonella enterica subsp. enterica]|nr:hypothetical protein KCP77_04080 [Salmonella enterica subsp. enterica]
MIVFSSLQIRRGVRVLLDNARAAINRGQKSARWSALAAVNLPLLALLKIAPGFYPARNWQLAWVNQETPALPP